MRLFLLCISGHGVAVLQDIGGVLSWLLVRCGSHSVRNMNVWKRLQRVGKRASKFRFTASYQELSITFTNKWYAQNCCIYTVSAAER